VTLIAAWTRRLAPQIEELVIAADSRLGGGQRWDACPKVFLLPRSDCAIAFCGSTYYAYPVVEQIRNAISLYGKSATRALDVCQLQHFLLAFLNGMVDAIHSLPSDGGYAVPPSDTRFLLGGYSWQFKAFFIWRILFDPKTNRYVSWRVGRNGYDRLLAFDGDAGNADDTKALLAEARERNGRVMHRRGRDPRQHCDFEPLEVIRDFSRERRFETVGGAPQLLKVYQHMNSLPFAVFWPDRASRRISFLGRPLLDYEIGHYLVMDVDTLETVRFDEARFERAALESSRVASS
jgi:hypothetical protein